MKMNNSIVMRFKLENWFPFRTIRLALAVWSFETALELAAKKDRVAALSKLNRAEKFFPNLIDTSLFKAILLFEPSTAEQSFARFRDVCDRIERSRLDETSKKYLMCYATYFGHGAARYWGDGTEFPYEHDCSFIDLKKVKPRLLRNFPIRFHPDWKDELTKKLW